MYGERSFSKSYEKSKAVPETIHFELLPMLITVFSYLLTVFKAANILIDCSGKLTIVNERSQDSFFEKT